VVTHGKSSCNIDGKDHPSTIILLSRDDGEEAATRSGIGSIDFRFGEPEGFCFHVVLPYLSLEEITTHFAGQSQPSSTSMKRTSS